jgi:hypothetical protein
MKKQAYLLKPISVMRAKGPELEECVFHSPCVLKWFGAQPAVVKARSEVQPHRAVRSRSTDSSQVNSELNKSVLDCGKCLVGNKGADVMVIEAGEWVPI